MDLGKDPEPCGFEFSSLEDEELVAPAISCAMPAEELLVSDDETPVLLPPILPTPLLSAVVVEGSFSFVGGNGKAVTNDSEDISGEGCPASTNVSEEPALVLLFDPR